MTPPAPPATPLPQSNSERLLSHLEEDSLAARLVRAHGESNPREAMLAVIQERLAEVRADLDSAEG